MPNDAFLVPDYIVNLARECYRAKPADERCVVWVVEGNAANFLGYTLRSHPDVDRDSVLVKTLREMVARPSEGEGYWAWLMRCGDSYLNAIRELKGGVFADLVLVDIPLGMFWLHYTKHLGDERHGECFVPVMLDQ